MLTISNKSTMTNDNTGTKCGNDMEWITNILSYDVAAVLV